MAIMIITAKGEKSIFTSIREFASVSKDFVAQHGSIIEIIPNYTPQVPAGTCPDCGSDLQFIEGCKKCHSCGYSACG